LAQDLDDTLDGFVRLSDAPLAIEPPVTFLSAAPEIDGRLDDALADLPVRQFTHYRKHDEGNPLNEATYRLAYGTEFFYVYVEADADEFAFRDRAYQNGDGFVVVLAAPRPDDAPTDEFYVVACSAVDKPETEWSRRLFWYYNVEHIFLRPSRETLMEFQAADGKIGFELLLLWGDVHPYHPWISDSIGFNISFVKAIGDRSKNEHIAVADAVGAEMSPRRYARLVFADPVVEGPAQTFVAARRGHVRTGDAVGATAVTAVGEACEETAVVLVNTGEGDHATYAREQYECDRGLTKHEFSLPTEDLPPGGYRLEWYSAPYESRGKGGLTILPDLDAAVWNARLAAATDVGAGTRATLEFMIEELERDLGALKPYESSGDLRMRTQRVEDSILRAESGEDVYADRTGFFRRAFRSDLDGTLQPYAVRIPEEFDRSKTYPLMVFLHGSASDETTLAGVPFIAPNGFIQLGPLGRGVSNCYVVPEAQTDIAEAIDDVIMNYLIDQENIYLSGFSMGGYGVYRTHYETPGKFKALAVFSGDPDLANRWNAEGGSPNFTDEEYLRAFDGIPVFIFHGETDRNAPFEKTEEAVEKLRTAGADVEFVTEPDKGHSSPAQETIEAYHAWLLSMLDRE